MAKFSVELSVYEAGRKRPQYTLDSDLNGEITLQELLEHTKASLIVIADEVLKEEQANGFDKKPILAVDGRVGKPIQNVSPLGEIEFTARQNVSDILLETYQAILYRSKVLTGRYKSSNFVFLNGQQVATDLQSLTAWIGTNPTFKESDLVRFVNIQPYARKLERFGVTAQRSNTRYEQGRKTGKHAGKLIQSPNGNYFLTARAIRAKYKRNSSIRFQFISGGNLGIKGEFQSGGRKGKNSAGRPYLYPSITISVSERGTT